MNLTNCKIFLMDQMESYFFEKRQGKRRTPVLIGSPGIGKSAIWGQAISDFNTKFSSQLKSKFNIDKIPTQDYRIILYNPIDLKGLPVPVDNKTKYFPIDRFTFNDRPQLLVFEEFDKGGKDVQNAALEILYDYAVDGQPFSKTTMILCTANNVSDNAYSNQLSNALKAGRIVEIGIEFNYDVFMEYCDKNLNSLITSFLRIDSNKPYAYEAKASSIISQKPYPCPRSWEVLSDIMTDIIGYSKDGTKKDKIKLDDASIAELYSSCVGISAGTAFETFVSLVASINIDKIIESKSLNTKSDEDATVTSMAFAHKFGMIWEKELKAKFNEKQLTSLLKLFTQNGFDPTAKSQIVRTILLRNKAAQIMFLKIAPTDPSVKDIISTIDDYTSELEIANKQ